MLSFSKFLAESITLQYHNELNPKLWDSFKLKPEVRQKLLQFAETWRQYADIPARLIQDIVMTGGNANYNYTKESDIDVHLIVDRNAFDCDRAIVDELLQAKKTLWSMTHDVKVYGYPLEPYAQDPSETYPSNQGVYSLKHNKWIQAPTKLSPDFLNDPLLEKKANHYKSMIDHMIQTKADLDTFNKLKDKLRTMRGAAIQKSGEFSFENLVFKELRNTGYLDKMSRYIKNIEDQELSL
jgi:hypothetical protein